MSFCLYNKKNITRRLEDMNLIFSWQKQYFTHSLCSFVKFFFCHSKIKFISSHHRVISSIYPVYQTCHHHPKNPLNITSTFFCQLVSFQKNSIQNHIATVLLQLWYILRQDRRQVLSHFPRKVSV